MRPNHTNRAGSTPAPPQFAARASLAVKHHGGKRPAAPALNWHSTACGEGGSIPPLRSCGGSTTRARRLATELEPVRFRRAKAVLPPH